ncbi:Rho termination factor N-terminal domain-containing protein [Scytonema sp. NUACC26]|uniref:Rho termination factor N-terminal domain-containing protein n=1 Tax=Scytonema sp. NUACC26 TaxID=3140176 RepID=UPI0034DC8476
MSLSDVGNLMCLPIDEIEPGEGTDAPEFLVQAVAKTLNRCGSRNWIPAIVTEVGEDRYKVIGNSFIFAVAESAGLEKVWCIIADKSEQTSELTKVLARESVPKVNLSTATRDEIQSALQYLIEKPASELKGIKLLVATNRIDEAPRQYWKTLEPITNLKCGITKGKKLNSLKEVFYLTPQPMPQVITDVGMLNTLTVTQLKDMAKKRGISGYAKKKKPELVEVLSKG